MKRLLSVLCLALLLSSCNLFLPSNDAQVIVFAEPLSREVILTLSVNGQTEVQRTLPKGEELEPMSYVFRKDDLLNVTAVYIDEPDSQVNLSTRLVFTVPGTFDFELDETSTGLSLSCEDNGYTEAKGCPQP